MEVSIAACVVSFAVLYELMIVSILELVKRVLVPPPLALRSRALDDWMII